MTIILGAAVPEQRAHDGWSEGLAVLGTALIVVFIGAGQDYSKELQFQKLNALKDIIEVKVVRDGKQVRRGRTWPLCSDGLVDGLVGAGRTWRLRHARRQRSHGWIADCGPSQDVGWPHMPIRAAVCREPGILMADEAL